MLTEKEIKGREKEIATLKKEMRKAQREIDRLNMELLESQVESETNKYKFNDMELVDVTFYFHASEPIITRRMAAFYMKPTIQKKTAYYDAFVCFPFYRVSKKGKKGSRFNLRPEQIVNIETSNLVGKVSDYTWEDVSYNRV